MNKNKTPKQINIPNMSDIRHEELLSKTISFLRFPLIVGVVFIHNNLSSVNIQGEIIRFDQWPAVQFIMNLCSSVLAAISVPLFFVFSGFLLFYKVEDFNKSVYIKKLRNRSKSLLIPYLIWNFIGFLILLIELHPIFSSLFPLLRNYRIDITHFLSYFWVAKLPISMSGPGTPIDTPLWFVRDIFVIVTISPILFWTIKKIKYAFIIFLFVIWFFTLGKHINFPSLSHQSLFFFPLGAFLSINKINIVQLVEKMNWIPYTYVIIAIADTLTINESYNFVIHNIGIIIGIITVVYFASTLIKKRDIKSNSFLSNASFFVYALHNLFIGKCTKIIVLITHPNSPFIIIFLYFFMVFFTITICLLIYWTLNKYIPSVAKIMTGGR